MFKTGLLLLTSPIPVVKARVAPILSEAAKIIRDTLYIHLAPANGQSLQPTHEISSLVTNIYLQTSHVCSHVNVLVMLSHINAVTSGAASFRGDLDVVLTDHQDLSVQDIPSQYLASSIPPRMEYLPAEQAVGGSEVSQEAQLPMRTHRGVVIGGTFDRLHNGHKILLSTAGLLAENKLVVGVTEGPMIENKKLNELIESTENRISAVERFLETVKPSIQHQVVPIVDPYGPSIVDPDLQCIVVSQETIKGGHAVNNKRIENGLNKLKVEVIEIVWDPKSIDQEESKVSSSNQRIRLLGTLLQQPVPKPGLFSTYPYVIGLTGGIASGKSSVAMRLAGLGAAIVDCDKLGHQAYTAGTPTYHQIVEEFGTDVVGEDGEINRTVLGSKVFADKSRLQTLNQIMWPAILAVAKEEIDMHHKKGKQVVVLDAAILLEAGWDSIVHEIWVATVPEKEALKRIMERDGASQEKALQRIGSQLSNKERVARANVVLCTLWEPELTQKQVEKAWRLLTARLHNHHL